MQPPSVTDILAIADSMRRQKRCLDDQILALHDLASRLDMRVDDPPYLTATGAPTCLYEAIARFVRAYTAGLGEQAAGLDASIRQAERVLEARQSQLVLPHLVRKPTQ